MTAALIAHGGAGSWRPGSEEEAIDGMAAAVEIGRALLLRGGSAVDAVCATVVLLEDNPIFNAGTGAVLNFDGFCELDASVMESGQRRMGAVCALQRVKNPVLVARKVMEETDHAILAGEGAQRFARIMGFGDHDPVTPARRDKPRRKTPTRRQRPSSARARSAASRSSRQSCTPSTTHRRRSSPRACRRRRSSG